MNREREPSALNLFGGRRLNMLPPSFHTITVPATYNTRDSIVRWIHEHCKSRYYVERSVSLNNGTIEQCIKIGFEDPKESSYCMLACPHLKYQ